MLRKVSTLQFRGLTTAIENKSEIKYFPDKSELKKNKSQQIGTKMLLTLLTVCCVAENSIVWDTLLLNKSKSILG